MSKRKILELKEVSNSHREKSDRDSEEKDHSIELSPQTEPNDGINKSAFKEANPIVNPLTGFNASSTSTTVSDDIIEKYFSQGLSTKSIMYPMDIDPLLREEAGPQLMTVYHGLFDYWFNQLRAGFNVLLYGMGSKMKLIDKFYKTKLSSMTTMTIYGFFPEVNIKSILNTITSEVFEHTGRFKTINLQCQFIYSSLVQVKVKELYLIIHNIDGKTLQDNKSQHALSILASCPYVHIMASIDHPRAPLLWDEITMQHFNWIWHHTPTYEQYTTEASYDTTATSNESDDLVLSSVTHVLTSLTSNARGIFRILANYQLDHKDDSSFTGLSFSQLYQKCRETFLVSSDVSLRAQLTEFKDHKIIQFKKGQDGAELITVPIKATILEQLLAAQFDTPNN